MQAVTQLVDVAIAYFKSASPDVQAAIVGNAGIAFTTFLTLLATGFIAFRQFKNERVEKAADRALGLKKEVLLDGVRGAQAVFSGIAAMGTLDKPVEQILTDFQAGVGRLTAASVVASPATVQLGQEFLGEAGPAFVAFLAERKPLADLQTEINVASQMIESLLADNKVLLARRLDAHLTGSNDESSKIGAIVDANLGRIDEYVAERDRHYRDLEPRHISLIRDTLAKQAELAPLMRQLIAAVRIDVGIDQDSKAYLAAATIDDSKPLRVFDEILPRLKGVPEESV